MFLLNTNKSIGTNETFLGVQNKSGLRETWEISLLSCKGCSFYAIGVFHHSWTGQHEERQETMEEMRREQDQESTFSWDSNSCV